MAYVAVEFRKIGESNVSFTVAYLYHTSIDVSGVGSWTVPFCLLQELFLERVGEHGQIQGVDVWYCADDAWSSGFRVSFLLLESLHYECRCVCPSGVEAVLQAFLLSGLGLLILDIVTIFRGQRVHGCMRY